MRVAALLLLLNFDEPEHDLVNFSEEHLRLGQIHSGHPFLQKSSRRSVGLHTKKVYRKIAIVSHVAGGSRYRVVELLAGSFEFVDRAINCVREATWNWTEIFEGGVTHIVAVKICFAKARVLLEISTLVKSCLLSGGFV